MLKAKTYTKLKIFQMDQAAEIQRLAQALDPNDILEAWDTTKEDLEQSKDRENSQDYEFFMDNFRIGRLAGKGKAVNAMMNGLNGKEKTETALKYLKNFSQSWKDENQGSSNPIGLRIVLDNGPADAG